MEAIKNEKRRLYKTIYQNLKRLRMQENISLAELGSRSHVPLWMLEELEQGRLPKEMMVTDACRLAKVFHCPVHELFQ